MTDELIERIAERKMDELDKKYLTTEMSTREYNKAVQEIESWVKTAKYWRDHVTIASILNPGKEDSSSSTMV